MDVTFKKFIEDMSIVFKDIESRILVKVQYNIPLSQEEIAYINSFNKRKDKKYGK